MSHRSPGSTSHSSQAMKWANKWCTEKRRKDEINIKETSTRAAERYEGASKDAVVMTHPEWWWDYGEILSGTADRMMIDRDDSGILFAELMLDVTEVGMSPPPVGPARVAWARRVAALRERLRVKKTPTCDEEGSCSPLAARTTQHLGDVLSSVTPLSCRTTHSSTSPSPGVKFD
ncbi:hypothetical protein E2C01_018323 [Portunus trituberculatus]|uniref:Uncharacterized protein n=1 Tax=Portunus trituberculatus TaxID=210409 RepID=A0A5B7DUU4_PORTR|nr:hypothetical protein [Portunus trituberculatus]